MIEIDMKKPEYCAQCPLMIVLKDTLFLPVFMCKIGWKELDHEYICKKRAEFCPIREDK